MNSWLNYQVYFWLKDLGQHMKKKYVIYILVLELSGAIQTEMSNIQSHALQRLFCLDKTSCLIKHFSLQLPHIRMSSFAPNFLNLIQGFR